MWKGVWLLHAHNVCVCVWVRISVYVCIAVHFATLLGDSAYPPRTELLDVEQKQRRREERKGNERWASPFLPSCVARSLTHISFSCSPSLSLSLCFTHIAAANRPCSFLSTNTHSHTGPTFASLNSLICTYARVCVWVYYLCFLCRQKNFYHKKITALVLSRLEKKQKKCISKI